MLQILSPHPDDVRRIQERDGAYYWSIAAAEVLRTAGLISVESVGDSPRPDGGPYLVLRDTEVTDEAWSAIAGGAVLFEAPLHRSVRARLGIEPRTSRLEAIDLEAKEPDAPLGRLEPPAIFVREDGAGRTPLDPADPYWACDGVEYHDAGLTPVPASAFRAPGVETGALLQTRGNATVLTTPLFDLAGRWTAWPPIEKLFAGTSNRSSPFPVVERVVREWVQGLTPPPRSPLVLADIAPAGKRAILTIRHDYDREIDAESCRALVDFYGRLGIRASVGFLDYRLPREQMRTFAEAGHEIQLHAHSQTLPDFQTALGRVTAAAGRDVVGFTTHGGPTGRKFLGDLHFRWAEASGLAYTDTRGPRDGYYLPITRIEEGLPYRCPVVATPDHLSLDRSTREGDHALDALTSKLPSALGRGRHVLVMNHPDLHRSALLELLGRVDLSNVWLATTAEAVAHTVATRLRSRVSETPGAVEIRPSVPLAVDSVFRAGFGRGRWQRIVLPAGAGAVSCTLAV